jgi:hypothetical protein
MRTFSQLGFSTLQMLGLGSGNLEPCEDKNYTAFISNYTNIHCGPCDSRQQFQQNIEPTCD